MKQLFNITGDGVAQSEVLVCELSHYHVCFAALNGNEVNHLSYYESATPITQSNLSHTIAKEALDLKSFKTLLIGNAFADCALVPLQVAQEKDIQSFLHNSGQKVFTDAVPQMELELVHAMPEYLLEVFEDGPSYQAVHVHTAALQSRFVNDDGNAILLHFTSKEFRVVALKNGQLQLAQIYPFTAPLDVVYYLLMISAQYDMPQADTKLILSGLLDEASALYKELYQYYVQVEFAYHPDVVLPPTDYHQHYFSSILNLAACASLVVR